MRPLQRVLLIEDQINIRNDLKRILQQLPGIIIVAEAGSIKEARIVIPATAPDLIFMDIILPDGDCFELLAELVPLSFRIIFLTGYERYAIRAIKFGALDYLLKPVDALEVASAIEKSITHSARPSREQVALTAQTYYDRGPGERIVLPSSGFWHIVSLTDILYVEGTNGSVFHMADGNKIATIKSLKDYEEILPAGKFLRAHQQYLIAHHCIARYHRAGYIILTNGIELPVSARRKSHVEDFLSNR